jgi:tRNA U34 5-methylaminomethyl-2-thiouridine-forming methyltransferase MnmC
MQKEIRLTADGSHTIAIPSLDITYHSLHGAIGESMHVYIEAGLLHYMNGHVPEPICIFEMGFGTGLNALLTLRETINRKQKVFYQSIEQYPLSAIEAASLNYGERLHLTNEFTLLHAAEWEIPVQITPFFSLCKTKMSLLDFSASQLFHCIYYDAFAPLTQPELWTEAVFAKLFHWLLPGSCLITYCSKSIVRKAMTAAGFRVEKIPGPTGKREMVRAWRDV